MLINRSSYSVEKQVILLWIGADIKKESVCF